MDPVLLDLFAQWCNTSDIMLVDWDVVLDIAFEAIKRLFAMRAASQSDRKLVAGLGPERLGKVKSVDDSGDVPPKPRK